MHGCLQRRRMAVGERPVSRVAPRLRRAIAVEADQPHHNHIPGSAVLPSGRIVVGRIRLVVIRAETP